MERKERVVGSQELPAKNVFYTLPVCEKSVFAWTIDSKSMNLKPKALQTNPP